MANNCSGRCTHPERHYMRDLFIHHVGSILVRWPLRGLYSCTNELIDRLRQCGHVFCGSCLINWFWTILERHVADHPTFATEPHLPAVFSYLLRHPQLPPRFQQRIQSIAHKKPPPPSYTCPICRREVWNKPIEAVALKSLARSAAEASRELVPDHPNYGWHQFFG